MAAKTPRMTTTIWEKTLASILLIAMMFLSDCAGYMHSLNVNSSGANHNNHDPQWQIAKLRQAAQKYHDLVFEPWWPITYNQDLGPGSSDPNIPMVRERLNKLGYIASPAMVESPLKYDSQLANAVKQYQNQHGLSPDSVIDQPTIDALNITPKQRLQQIKRNIERWQNLPQDHTRYVQVNIPSYELYVVDNKQHLDEIKVIVGEPDWPTPVMTSNITTVIVNPNWNIPSSITEQELVEKIAADPSYLNRNNIQVKTSYGANAKIVDPENVDWQKYVGPKKLPYKLVQSSGNNNVLGQIKFQFPNAHSIYLHDTPRRELFSLTHRDLSHGCIRLERPIAFLRALTDHSPGLNISEAMAKLQSGQTQYLTLTEPMPLYVTYITAWINNNSQIQFRPDIYHKDPI
jgi:murein L,D-transpeptidase YcbB/YkuD